MGNLTKGDRVKVVMARNSIFPWQSGPTFDAIYQHGPSGPGDVFVVDVPAKREQFTEHDAFPGVRINGNSSEFVGLYHTPTTGDDDGE